MVDFCIMVNINIMDNFDFIIKHFNIKAIFIHFIIKANFIHFIIKAKFINFIIDILIKVGFLAKINIIINKISIFRMVFIPKVLMYLTILDLKLVIFT